MNVDSIKRLLVLIAGTAVLYFGQKFGLSHETCLMITGLFATYLAQSGAKAIADVIGKHKALGMIAGELAKVKDAYETAKASQALSAGQTAAAAPGSPSQG